MTKHYPPTFNGTQFHCIHCGVFAKQTWETLYFHNFDGMSPSPIRQSTCEHCNDRAYWHDEKMVIPTESPIEPSHPDMPKNISDDYLEARAIFSRSPRAAAALLRLAVQKLMPILGQNSSNINHDIKSLVAQGLPPQVQQALDYCRVIGNNAVHPG